MASHIVGYPRMGPKREPKLALESFWDGKSIPGYLQKVAADLRESIWNPSVEYFIVPEWGPAVKFSYASHKGVTEYKEAKALGVDTVPVHSFRITNCGVHDTTQIHTHMCYSNLIDNIHAIIYMDDDVITIENSRSDEKLLSVIPIQRLIPAQMKEKRDKGLCFKCDHKWGLGQRCGGPKLSVIKETKGDRDPIDNTEDYLRYPPIELEGEIGISPPAISRSPIPKTMRVKTMVNSHEYIALIDTGSHLNFLHPRVAGEVGLKIINDDPIEVRIADGSIMCSEGRCPEFKFVIQGGQFATEAYILQLDGCDVILGIEWLMGLGPIKNWDFASLKMELTQGGKTIQIKGMDTEESEEGCSTDEKLVSMLREGVKYGAGIGPGVYDIHSPRIPSTEEIADRINKMLAVLETIQVNPDCGQPRRLSMIPAC